MQRMTRVRRRSTTLCADFHKSIFVSAANNIQYHIYLWQLQELVCIDRQCRKLVLSEKNLWALSELWRSTFSRCCNLISMTVFFSMLFSIHKDEKVKQGLTSHQTHYRPYWGQVSTCHQPTISSTKGRWVLRIRLQLHQVDRTMLTITQHICSMHTSHYVRYLRRKQTVRNLPPYPPHLKMSNL